MPMPHLGSSPVPERATTAETATDGVAWEIAWGPEPDAGEWVVVFRAWMSHLGTWRGRRAVPGSRLAPSTDLGSSSLAPSPVGMTPLRQRA